MPRAPALFAPTLDLSVAGNCPGNLTVDILGATPNGTIAIGWSSSLGSTTIPVGVCAGTFVDLSEPTLVATVTSDAGGGFSVTTSVPAQACGRYLQAVDLSSCDVSNVGRIPQ